MNGTDKSFCAGERSRFYTKMGLVAGIFGRPVSLARRESRDGFQLASPGLFLTGWAFLVTGVLFYCLARPQGIAYVSERLGLHLFPKLYSLPGPVWGSFPEFIHPMAFSLMGMGLLSVRRWSRLFVCSSILLLNLFFELGQKYKHIALEIVPNWVDGIPVIENVNSYFYRGTFDPQDVLAMCLGAAIAFVASELVIKGSGRGRR
jgi:hypothetical protein